jgi:transposase
MQLTFPGQLMQFLRVMQGHLFPKLEEELGPLTGKLRQLIAMLELVQIEAMVGPWRGGVGRPALHERAIARAFVAKAVYNLNSTRQLLDRLHSDSSLRRICGWENRREIPHESQFSRAFASFADSQLPQRIHAALIEETQKDRLVGHISRDSTEIEAREKPQSAQTEAAPAKPQRKRGRPKKGEQPTPPEPTRIERQAKMSLGEMLDDLPRACNVGTKKNSKGYKESWIGYKLHIDAADGQIPISCILTSASLHDSQAAIPLALMTSLRVTNLYDLGDSAYDAQAIHAYIRGLGHIPLIDVHPRSDQALKAELQAEGKRQKLLNFNYAEDVRYNERTTVERVNARLKDEFGGRMIRVRGHAKVMCHLMFGILALAADQILRLVT